MAEENIFKKEESPKAVLVSVFLKGEDERENEASLGELEQLLKTAGGEVYGVMTQSRETPDVRTYIGEGKVEELKEICENNEIPLVVFDRELSPSQIRNLEKELENVRVIDRTMLILDIFALHAVSGEGKLQVELAQLKYTIPRLSGKGAELSRLGGGIGTRGPGESKLESDKRHLKHRIAALEAQAEELRKNRSTMRRQRDRSGIFKLAIAGYTNAGKSTLLNFLTDAGILAENKLFATLDPTTRKFELPSGEEILLTDTVGFIRNLPTHLVKAFRSTLDEVAYCDALLLIVDASDPEYKNQIAVTQELLGDLEAGSKPVIYVFNKMDNACEEFRPCAPADSTYVTISAKTGDGIESLKEAMEAVVSEGKTKEVFTLPPSRGDLLNYLYANANVLDCDYTAEGTVVTAVVDKKTKGFINKALK
ncbi:MAG: GTPase HflX [Clostridia bacterium]|nr:GTPase HflX [Clostridia bacterium]